MLNESEFVASRKPTWDQLRYQSLRLESNPKDFDRAAVVKFLELYDAVARDLSRARSETGNQELIESLNDVLVKANRAKYRLPPVRQKLTVDGVLYEVAKTVRRKSIFIWLSAVIFLFANGVGWGVLQFRPELRGFIVQREMEENFAGWRSGKHEERTGNEAMSMWSLYATNNPIVSLQTAARGAATFGIGTTQSLWMNGVLIGALAQDTSTTGALGHLLTSIYPHGASEIFGLLVASAAGYSIAWGLLVPGKKGRLESLIQASKSGFVLFALAMTMMFIAAPFEAWFSFNPAFPASLKLVIGTIVLISWLSFFGLYGKHRDVFEPAN